MIRVSDAANTRKTDDAATQRNTGIVKLRKLQLLFKSLDVFTWHGFFQKAAGIKRRQLPPRNAFSKCQVAVFVSQCVVRRTDRKRPCGLNCTRHPRSYRAAPARPGRHPPRLSQATIARTGTMTYNTSII